MELTEIRDQINKLGTDMTALTAKARDEKRDLTSDEEALFDKMDADRERLLKTEQRALKAAEIEGGERRSAHVPPGRTPESRGDKGAVQASAADRTESLRSWLQAASDVPLTLAQRQACERSGVNPNSKSFKFTLPRLTPTVDGYSGGRLALRENDFAEWEKRALSTLSSTSPEDGNYLIANEAMGPLERALLAFGGMRQASTIVRTQTGANYPIPTNNDTGNKGRLVAEGVIATKKDPAFGQLVLNSYRFSSNEILVSLELLQDSNENLAALIGSLCGEQIGRILNDYFTTGSGSSQPNGIVTASTASGTQLAAKTPTYAELVATEHAVDPEYRNGAAWMFHDTMFAEIKKITDASTGRPIWLPNMVQGAPDTILGYPYFINQSMAVAAASGAAKALLFGNLKKYIIRDVRDITLFRLDELYAEYYQAAFVAFSRHDGDLLDAGTHPVVHTLNKA